MDVAFSPQGRDSLPFGINGIGTIKTKQPIASLSSMAAWNQAGIDPRAGFQQNPPVASLRLRENAGLHDVSSHQNSVQTAFLMQSKHAMANVCS
jgi:hypothetical protein